MENKLIQTITTDALRRLEIYRASISDSLEYIIEEQPVVEAEEDDE